MTIQRELLDYSIARLGGQTIPADLNALLSAVRLGLHPKSWTDTGFAGSDRDPSAILGFRLLQPGQTHPLQSPHDYLTEADRANRDIMWNIEAIDATSGLCCFVAETEEGLVGYWRGPDGIEPDKASIVLLDTEGQYSLLRGRTISEALYFFLTRGSSAEVCGSVRKAFARLGISIADSDLPSSEASERPARFDAPHPNNYRDRLYNERRVLAGLPPLGS
jgi:hypothetical protein